MKKSRAAGTGIAGIIVIRKGEEAPPQHMLTIKFLRGVAQRLKEAELENRRNKNKVSG